MWLPSRKWRSRPFPISAAGENPHYYRRHWLYIQSVLYDIDFTENPEDDACRRTLEQTAEEKGPEYLHKMLAAVDREAAEQIHTNNVKRVSAPWNIIYPPEKDICPQ